MDEDTSQIVNIPDYEDLVARPCEVGPIRVSEPPDACRLRRGQMYETHDMVMMALNSYAVYSGKLQRRLTSPYGFMFFRF